MLIVVGLVVFGIALYFRLSGKWVLFQLATIVGVYLIFGFLFQVSLSEFLVAKKRFLFLVIFQITGFSVSIIGATAVAWFTHSIAFFVAFQLGSSSIIGLFFWLYIVKTNKLLASYQQGEIDKECVSYGLRMVPVDLITLTAGQLSNFIIGPFWGFTGLAIFSIASKLRDKIAIVIKSIRPLIYADFARLTEKELARKINKHLIYLGISGLGLSAALAILGVLYIRFFLPAKFMPAIKYMIILSTGLPAGFVVVVLHSIFETHLRYKQVSIAVVLGNIIKILLILIFGYSMQITGICIAIALSGWASLLIYYLLIFNKRISDRFQ